MIAIEQEEGNLRHLCGSIINMGESFFDIAFWRDMTAVFVGGALSIPAGLWINKVIQNSAAKEKERRVLITTDEALVSNLGRLNALMLATESFITDQMDLTMFDATATAKYEHLNDLELARKIDRIRSQLGDLETGLRLLDHATCTNLERLKFEDSAARNLIVHMRGRMQAETCPKIIAAIDECRIDIAKALGNPLPERTALPDVDFSEVLKLFQEQNVAPSTTAVPTSQHSVQPSAITTTLHVPEKPQVMINRTGG